MQRTGAGPLARQVLIVDSGLAEPNSAAARSVRALEAELRARNIQVLEALSYEDGLATVVSDAGIHCILLNWTQGSNDSGSHAQATELLHAVRARNAKVPIFLMASRKLAGSVTVEVATLADEYIWILEDTASFVSGRVQAAIERYIQAGGGYVGIHSATDTEYDWPWYGRLAGAYFNGHPNNPNVRKATYHVIDKSNPSTQGLPDPWDREDEFYNFKSIDPTIHVLVEIDEKSYEGGTNGDHHPMSWYHDFDGGRAWYTNMGHTEATFSDPVFLRHLLGGLRYAIGTGKIDFSRARPEENRFTRVVLAEKLDEPVELAVLPGERVLFIERHGYVNIYSPTTKRVKRIATIPVSTKYADSSHDDEDGQETQHAKDAEAFALQRGVLEGGRLDLFLGHI